MTETALPLSGNFRRSCLRAGGTSRFEIAALAILVILQALLIAYSASTHSPTKLEPAFLASGISHWTFQRFELYRVNPPMVRMIAAIPVLMSEHSTDWSSYLDYPGSRSEYPTGAQFMQANGSAATTLVLRARLMCIPFALIGSLFTYLWAREL